MLVKIFVLTVFLVTAVQTSVFAARQFTFFNNSGKTVDMFFATENYSDSWGNNIFDTTPVYNGKSVGIRLGSNARYWKFKVVFQDGSSTFWADVDMNSRWSTMTLNRDNSSSSGYRVIYR